MIFIKNLRKDTPTSEYDIRVDRSSVLGNPFKLSEEKYRMGCLDKYKTWLYEQFFIKHNNAIKEELLRIANLAKSHHINLYCWCYPKPCHAMVIRDFIITHLIPSKDQGFVCPINLTAIEYAKEFEYVKSL